MGIVLKEHIHYTLQITEDWCNVVQEKRKKYLQRSSLLQIKPRSFKVERGKDYPCYTHNITENKLTLTSAYFVGVDWLTEDRYIHVEPKLNCSVIESFEIAAGLEDEEQINKIDTEAKTQVKINEPSKEKEVDVIGMLIEIMSHAEISQYSDKLLIIDWEVNEVPVTQKQDLLTPFLIVKFLSILQKITRKGLKKAYYKVQENLRNKVKGKILIGQQIKQNTFKNRFTNTVCEYQVFGDDSLENRFLKKVFLFCINYVENQKYYFKEKNNIDWLINYIRPSFEKISSEIDIEEIKNYKHNPFFKEYKEAIIIGKQILKRFSYNITKTREEKSSTPPFWIDMPKMFELYVFAKLLKDNPELNVESFNYQFSTYGNALDFLICSVDKKIVVDAKYKLHYNYSQVHNDIRQVSGYARLKKVREKLGFNYEDEKEIPCLIIYPKPAGSKNGNKLKIDNLINENNKIDAYHKIYKIGIDLPLIKSI